MNTEAIESWYRKVTDEYRSRTHSSAALFHNGKKYLPGGDTRFSVTIRPHPLYFTRGEGPHVWDADGNKFLDLGNNASALIHGHAHPSVVKALQTQVAKGTSWSAHNEHQVKWARMLCERVPSLDRVRFVNSGTEANMLMLKVARAATGKSKFLKLQDAYHGTYDGVEVRAHNNDPENLVPSALGVPRNLTENVIVGQWGDADGIADMVHNHQAELAAVVLTPFASAGGYLEPPTGFLETIRSVTEDHGVLLLFDEVISLRLAPGGAQQRYGVTPDMTAMGKLVGGGLPVGAFGGREDIMSVTSPDSPNGLALAGTFNGNPLTAVAGISTLELLEKDAYKHLDELGEMFQSGLAAEISEAGLPLQVTGGGSLISVLWNAEQAEEWPTDTAEKVQHGLTLSLVNSGIWGYPFMALSTVMDKDDISHALQVSRDALQGLISAF